LKRRLGHTKWRRLGKRTLGTATVLSLNALGFLSVKRAGRGEIGLDAALCVEQTRLRKKISERGEGDSAVEVVPTFEFAATSSAGKKLVVVQQPREA